MGILGNIFSLFKKSSGDGPVGEVKWFSNSKGYGFITPDDGSEDVFVHISAVEDSGLRTLNKGQQISYELQSRNDRISAVNLAAHN